MTCRNGIAPGGAATKIDEDGYCLRQYYSQEPRVDYCMPGSEKCFQGRNVEVRPRIQVSAANHPERGDDNQPVVKVAADTWFAYSSIFCAANFGCSHR